MVLILQLYADRTIAAEAIVEIDPYIARKVFCEEHWQHKIERSLKYVTGVIVCVNVELTTEVSRTVAVQGFEGESSTQLEYVRSSSREDSAPVFVASKNGKSSQQDATVEEESLAKYIQPIRNETTEIAGLLPSKVQVAISVPESYVTDAWQQKNLLGGNQGKTNTDKTKKQLALVKKEVTSAIKETLGSLLPGGREKPENISIVYYADAAP